MRLAVDTGGTFTDLVLESDEHGLHVFKSSTTPDDPVRGVLDVLDVAAGELATTRAEILGRTDLLVHATTHAINAILTGMTARTALLVTEGHPDILLFREGGRLDAFDFTRAFPDPYVPRHLTFEVPERIGANGAIVRALDASGLVHITRQLAEREVEAVAVCLLWSIKNPVHELAIGRCLETHLPGVPYTLSHELNPIVREYRRASSTAIDASLRPLMGGYLRGLEQRLRGAGFSGRLLMVTSSGGLLAAAEVGRTPIHSVKSGPAMAPVAGQYYARVETGSDTVIVADTGGTTYDVSLVRRGRIPFTQETWVGSRYEGHMTGFPSVDVKSIGAGGGSIAWVDEGGLLRVGPKSAGAVPGPACYGRGGRHVTVTDAALVLGFLDPAFFLGGVLHLDEGAAARAMRADVADPLGIGPREAAAAVIQVATEQMVRAIKELTLEQGIDPRSSVLVGGGGAAGLNIVAVARRLGSKTVLIPDVAAVLSAAGALISDLRADYVVPFETDTAHFDVAAVNAVLEDLEDRCRSFASEPGAGAVSSQIEFTAAGRYPHQVWELDVRLPVMRFAGQDDVQALRGAFHRLHEEVFAISDLRADVELVSWRATVRCRLRDDGPLPVHHTTRPDRSTSSREVHFPDFGPCMTTVHLFDDIEPGAALSGPAIVESPVTTVVLDPDSTARRSAQGALVIAPTNGGEHDSVAASRGRVP